MAIAQSAADPTAKGGGSKQDLRTYLDALLKANPNAIKVVEDEVDPEFEATALVHKILNDPEYPGFPAVLFKNVKGSDVPLMLNLHGTYERVALSIGSDVQGMVQEYARREGNPIPPVMVDSADAPVHEVVWTGDQIDITKLPFLVHNELDAGRYITSAATISRDPDSRPPERRHLPPPGPGSQAGRVHDQPGPSHLVHPPG